MFGDSRSTNHMRILPGTAVTLKGGSPVMTVLKDLGEGSALCAWFSASREYETATIPIEALCDKSQGAPQLSSFDGCQECGRKYDR